MTSLLEIREKVLALYVQFENYINMAFRFVSTLLAMAAINSQISYQKSLAGILPALIVALLATVIPLNLVVVVLGIVILIQLYSLSLEAAAIGAVLFLVLLLIYMRFTPGDTILLILYPFCRMLGIQAVLPIAGGLLFTPASGVTVAVGVIADSFIRFVHQNEATITGSAGTSSTDSMVTNFQFLLDGIMQDKAMMVSVVAVVIAAVAVYVIRRLMIPYAWTIAAGVGSLLQLLILIIGAMVGNAQISVGLSFIGAIVGFVIGAVIAFIAFNLDYSRTESTQFEDDEYYYYVKAVPKNALASPRRTVRTVNARKGSQRYEDEAPRRSPRREERPQLWEEPAEDARGYGNGYDNGYDRGYEPLPQDSYEDEFQDDF